MRKKKEIHDNSSLYEELKAFALVLCSCQEETGRCSLHSSGQTSWITMPNDDQTQRRRRRKIHRKHGLQHSLLIAAITLSPPPTGRVSAFGTYKSAHQSALSFHREAYLSASWQSSALTSTGRNHTEPSGPHDHKKLEDDIAQKFSVSKDRAISALSQPLNPKNKNTRPLPSRNTSREKNHRRDSERATIRRTKNTRMNGRIKNSSGPRERSKHNPQRDSHKPQRTTQNKPAYSSLLPPPLTTSADDEDDDPLSTGLSSWEEFLGVGSALDQASHSSRTPIPSKDALGEGQSSPHSSRSNSKSTTNGIPVMGDELAQRLPSIQDLFPPDLSASTSNPSSPKDSSRSSPRPRSQVSLDGVLPVSDLFYRSSSNEEHDDEELPFSAEQSDAVSSENNKVRIRRNLATQKPSPTTTRRGTQGKSRGRKMVRRGMEMLVGGVPINADPPQRSVELLYNRMSKDWVSTISLNTRDFGPLLHTASMRKLIDLELGLFAEYWTRAALKWDICPKDLRQIVKTYSVQKAQRQKGDREGSLDGDNNSKSSGAVRSSGERIPQASDPGPKTPKGSYTEKRSTIHDSVELSASKTTNRKAELLETDGECTFELGLSRDDLESSPSEIFKSVFSRAFLSVIKKALIPKNKDSRSEDDLRIDIPKLFFTETDDGYTDVHVSFKIVATTAVDANPTDLEKRTKRLNEILQQALDDGEIAIALAAAAQEERRWPQTLRERFIEECLFQDDVLDEDVSDTEPPEFSVEMTNREDETDEDQAIQPSLIISEPESATLYAREDIFLGSGNDGVFCDFSAGNVLNAPFGGEIGLRLVDAVVERAKQRNPRVIAIGDVHGCIDELQDLLRECDYRPGDLVVFLGDLVCKGPDSISVVQMAREIGAIGIRGNHDFEVVRWHQAIKSGVDPPVVGSEHFHIASCLSKADMKWMYSLPWYISSKDLGALFVHAGFVSGIRLAKQNPRLMMNMRSILPDGTVTSKFFNNWPWARLWDGPQTVLFGHGTL